MFTAGTLEYNWGALSGSIQAKNHWGLVAVFWMFSVYVIFESVVSHPLTGWLRDHNLLRVRYIIWIGGSIGGIVSLAITGFTGNLLVAYLGFSVLGGIGGGMIYNTCITMTAKWYPDRKGWRTGFVDGGWPYGAVPWIIAIGALTGSAAHLSVGTVKTILVADGIVITVVTFIAGWFMVDPPKNWWPKQVDPLNWTKYKKRSTAGELAVNPPAVRQAGPRVMWRTPQAKWIGIEHCLFVGASLFGVAFVYPFGQAMGLGAAAVIAGAIGFDLLDGFGRTFYGWMSEIFGRRPTMVATYIAQAVFLMLTYWMGLIHQPVLFAICAFLAGSVAGTGFAMAPLLVADYYGENYNAINYATIYSWKALGGSFAGGLAAIIMTGNVLSNGTPNWFRGFVFGAILVVLAALVLGFLVKQPTLEQITKAEEGAAAAAARRAKKRGQPVGT
jgi:MFS family permease